MIEVKNLTFDYPGVRALDDVSLTIPGGDITALVGPNGAGKTTLMRCLVALDTPIDGSVTLNGTNVFEYPRECHRRMGYLPDFFGLYSTLTVRQCLTYFAQAQQIPASKQKDAVELAASRLQIADRMNQKAGALSRGLSQRLAIAQAIVHQPEFVILDEPASGLDPEARHSLSNLFLELKAAGMTLIVSSHILSELEEYSDHMIIVKKGKIVKHTDVAHAQSETVVISITTHQAHPDILQTLESIEGIQNIQIRGKKVSFRYYSDPEKQHTLLRTLLDHGLTLTSMSPQANSLQHTYMEQVGMEQASRETE